MVNKRIQKVQKFIRRVCKVLGLQKRRRHQRMSNILPSPSKLMKLRTPERSNKWREQIEDTCFLYDNIRFNQQSTDMAKQSKIYRDELTDMRQKIEKLQVERQLLSRALQTMEPIEKQNDSFLVLEQTSKLDLTPPPPMTPLMDYPKRRVSRDSAYDSDLSPKITKRRKSSKFDHITGEYVSNGCNTYFIAL